MRKRPDEIFSSQPYLSAAARLVSVSHLHAGGGAGSGQGDWAQLARECLRSGLEAETKIGQFLLQLTRPSLWLASWLAGLGATVACGRNKATGIQWDTH